MGWFALFIYAIGYYVGISIMLEKAGTSKKRAWIPIYNIWLVCEICSIKKIWFWLQLVPIIGAFVKIWIAIIFSMHFGKYNLLHHTAIALVPFIYLPCLGLSQHTRWGGRAMFNSYKKPVSREWIDSIVFAVIAASIIRTFFFEAYVIPSESMEKTLLVNDFLFVDKLAYGPRIPSTPLSFPFVHNTMPFNSFEPSYLTWITLPYKRIPGFTSIKRNDVVIFNFPEGDTIINEPNYLSFNPYYDVLRMDYKDNRTALLQDHEILVHPYDKTDNYIKRCVGMPNDTLYIHEGILYINNQPAFLPPTSQTEYLVETNGTPFTTDLLESNLGYHLISNDEGVYFDEKYNFRQLDKNSYVMNLTPEKAQFIKNQPNVTKITNYIEVGLENRLFPFDMAHFNWGLDNYGPVIVPKKGVTVKLTKENIALYKRAIITYEQNTLQEDGDNFVINGVVSNQYTFKYNYYWMMGDNRHQSQDSRFWGFVPEFDIVGKASLIWFSWKNGIRWDRLFKPIH